MLSAFIDDVVFLFFVWFFFFWIRCSLSFRDRGRGERGSLGLRGERGEKKERERASMKQPPAFLFLSCPPLQCDGKRAVQSTTAKAGCAGCAVAVGFA